MDPQLLQIHLINYKSFAAAARAKKTNQTFDLKILLLHERSSAATEETLDKKKLLLLWVYIYLLSVQQKNPKLVFCQFVIIRVWAFQFCMQKMTLFVSMVEEDKRRFWWFTEHHDLTSFTFSPSLWGWWWWQSCQQLCLLDHACDSVKTRMLRLPITMTIVLNLDLERTSAPSNVRGPSKLACFIWLLVICIKRSSFQSWELVHTIAEMFTFANSGNCISCCTPLCMCKFSKCIPCWANLAYENSIEKVF